MTLSLRNRLLFFFITLAIIPLLFSSYSMITTTQDELKSAVNQELLMTSRQLTTTIDNTFSNTWLAPLELIRKLIDNSALGLDEKLALLQNGVGHLEGLVALEFAVKGFPPSLFVQEPFSKQLQRLGTDAQTLFSSHSEAAAEAVDISHPYRLQGSDTWLLDITLPLAFRPSGQSARLIAHVNLEHLMADIFDHPFASRGNIWLLSKDGKGLLGKKIPASMASLLKRDNRLTINNAMPITVVQPFSDSVGKAFLGVTSQLDMAPWLLFVTLEEDSAYMVVTSMRHNLFTWVTIGLLAAVLGALFLSRQVTRPISEIARVVLAVGNGDLNVRVDHGNKKDELGRLGCQINEMIQGLLERFHLQKFVSGGTLSMVSNAGLGDIKLGGERRNATLLFSDIRNFTSFSEKQDPEEVIGMLNTYLRAQANIIKRFQGDVDKFIGDEVIAIFQGQDQVDNAIRCANEIHRSVAELNQNHPSWQIELGIGINSGEVVIGAIGSEERMDFTMIGDAVNIASRLCDTAQGGWTLITEWAVQKLENREGLILQTLEPIQLKGITAAINICSVSADESLNLHQTGSL